MLRRTTGLVGALFSSAHLLGDSEVVYRPLGPANRLSSRSGRLRLAATATSEPGATQAAAAALLQALPTDLRNATAVLTTPAGARAYVLGISHVSEVALEQIQALVQAVQPDAVLVELCKDRTGLLVDASAPPPQAWHAARVQLPGLPTDEGWPTLDQLVGLLRCRGSSPVSAVDLEDDAVALLSTGLFASVRLVARPPSAAACAPAFVVQSGGRRLATVAPLGAVEFVVAPRSLPALQELTCTAAGLDIAAEQLDAVGSAAVQRCAAGTPALASLLQARQALLAAAPEAARAEVVFSGVEGGKVSAVVRAAQEGRQPELSGLEGSAVGGAGWGITPFKRQAKAAGATASAGGLRIELPGSSGSSTAAATQQTGASAGGPEPEAVRPWSVAELAAAEAGGPSAAKSNPLADLLTQTYARLQAKAGKTVGIQPGAAWRTALQAAAATGASRVYLGDRPASTTAERLAAGILGSASLPLLASLPASLASAVIVAQGLPNGAGGAGGAVAVVAAAVLPLAVGAWPVVAPLAEVSAFAGKQAAEIEELVRVKEPLQLPGQAQAPVYKLWGEDALLGWPGAMEPIIHQRDAYMARALLAAATGRPEGLTPAYVATAAADGRTVLHYAQPEGGLPAACPPGTGAGTYAPRGERAVVAVVGTAHVRGIAAAWQQQLDAQGECSLAPFL